MMKTTEILMNEHQNILKKLDELNLFLQNLNHENLSKVPYYLDFIQIYADEFHHAKEEKIYFEWMINKDIQFKFGPIACMLNEHEQGRHLIKSCREILLKSEVTLKDLNDLKNKLYEFITLLTEHIKKEDNVLYQFAEEINEESNDGDQLMLSRFLQVKDNFSQKYEI